MIIDVLQTISERKNEFDIFYNNKKIYKAKLPFITMSGIFNLEKIREIRVFDLNNKIKYETSYNYIDNQIEEFLPLKYLITNSQKFNQFKFINKDNNEKILLFFEMKEIWNGYCVIKYKENFYNCYSVEDGYIKHVCIYKDDTQVAELVKPNIIIDGKDTYRIYLKNEYDYLADACTMLALYLDRTEYNSSYLKNKSSLVSKNFSYSKVNKYYDSNWIKNNFKLDNYFNEINNEIIKTKKEIKTSAKKLLIIMGIVWGILIFITILLLIILL